MTTYVHGDKRVCEHRDDGTWTIRENPDNRGSVGLDCPRHPWAHPDSAMRTRVGDLADGWDEAVEAVSWALSNGPSDGALLYVAKHNPYRAGTTAAIQVAAARHIADESARIALLESQLAVARAALAACREVREARAQETAWCDCPPCPGRGNDGHGMTHCAECCFGTFIEADQDCPIHGYHAIQLDP